MASAIIAGMVGQLLKIDGGVSLGDGQFLKLIKKKLIDDDHSFSVQERSLDDVPRTHGRAYSISCDELLGTVVFTKSIALFDRVCCDSVAVAVHMLCHVMWCDMSLTVCCGQVLCL